MVGLTRRTFFGACALGAFAASTPVLAAGASPVPLRAARVPAPVGVLTRLPGDGNQLALTVDDGCSTADVAALGRFCADTGMRLTFFVNGINPSWTVNAPLLQPMVSSGQIQLGNHTWSHADITRISPAALAEQIGRNADFLRNTYGVDGSPYFRPPFGRHNADTDRIAADHGYPTITLWSAAIGDSRPIDEAAMIANAQGCLRPTDRARPREPAPRSATCSPNWQTSSPHTDCRPSRSTTSSADHPPRRPTTTLALGLRIPWAHHTSTTLGTETAEVRTRSTWAATE